MKYLLLLIILTIISLCKNGYGQNLDLIPPEPPLKIDSVSVNPMNDEVYLCWWSSPSEDVMGYRVYKYHELLGTFYLIDTINDVLDTSIIINPNLSQHWSEKYTVQAFDSAGNTSLMTEYHNTIYITPFLITSNSDSLIWTPYVNWDSSVSKYEIFVRVNSDDAFLLLDSVPGDQHYYIHTNMESNTYYSYFVRAYSNDGKTSTSYLTSISTNISLYSSQELVKCYPNPTSGKINIIGKAIDFVEITNTSGQIVYKQAINNDRFTVDISNQNTGIYFINVIRNNAVSIHKLVLE